jgi:tetraprenyl-beta-curcumene synthase
VFGHERPVRSANPSTRRPTPIPAALSARQLRVLGEATGRELAWVLPAVAREVRAWRSLAAAIPDRPIRQDALSSLANKRGHTDGAALFCIFTRSREPALLRLLVAYEIMWDFLDSVNERGAARGLTNGKQLHLALVDGLDPDRPASDYYRHHPWHDDGGYLNTLVQTCRETCALLPSYEIARPLLIQEAWRAQVLAINHELDPHRRASALREWVHREWPNGHQARWYELTGAASASLTIHALLAQAAEPQVDPSVVTGVYRAYGPWISAATTMLDSHVDQLEDAVNGDHSYVAHYPTADIATRRISTLISRSMQEASSLPDSERHILIVACMTAMYLSKNSAWKTALRSRTLQILPSAGPLARLLLPILRLWRITYSQGST